MTHTHTAWQWLGTGTRLHLFLVCTAPEWHVIRGANGRAVTQCGIGAGPSTVVHGLDCPGSRSPVCKLCLRRWEREVLEATVRIPVPQDVRV